VQNELVLAALKTATDHLIPGGTFCTKVYRSADYNSLVWVLQQLFEDVQTVKPNSSRSQSSEIFLVCLKYTAPKFIDPKFLDPNHVFKEVVDPGLQKVDVMHKKYDKLNKRHRTGYDESLGMLLTSTVSVSSFVASKVPVRVLTDAHKLEFTSECEKYKIHPKTTEELKICFSDLRLLGKVDFKKILKWRQAMIEEFGKEGDGSSNDEGSEDAANGSGGEEEPELTEEQQIQMDILKFREQDMRERRKEKKKSREKESKERTRQALGMSNKSFGVDEDAELFTIDASSTRDVLEKIADVNLTSTDAKDLRFSGFADEMNESEEEEAIDRLRKKNNGLLQYNEDEMDDELEMDYIRYLAAKSSEKRANKKERKANKDPESALDGDETRLPSTKKAAFLAQSEQRIAGRATDDRVLLANAAEELENYVQLLTNNTQPSERTKEMRSRKSKMDGDSLAEGGGPDLNNNSKRSRVHVDSDASSSDSEWEGQRSASEEEDTEGEEDSGDDENDDDDDDEEDQQPIGRGKNVKKTKQQKTVDQRPLVTRDSQTSAAKTNVWFSNPIFKSALITNEENPDADIELPNKSSKRSTARKVKSGSDSDDAHLLDSMPLTDKEKRQLKRKKDKDRQDRKLAKHQRKDDLDTNEVEIAFEDEVHMKKSSKRAREDGLDEDTGRHAIGATTATSDLLEKRKLIKEGMGVAMSKSHGGNSKADSSAGTFEVVPQQVNSSSLTGDLLSVKDTRSYDSDNEMYDSHDRIQTLALATMMLRNSKKKALVDASYNRFAWNDAKDLPSWFVDDETRHNKPQLPIPQALVDKVRSASYFFFLQKSSKFCFGDDNDPCIFRALYIVYGSSCFLSGYANVNLHYIDQKSVSDNRNQRDQEGCRGTYAKEKES
jgi:hypothetical protein